MTNIESHVTSRELSKRLRESGVPRESLFYWWNINRGNRGEAWEVSNRQPSKDTADDECYSAFLASEIGEMLPGNFTDKHDSVLVLSTHKGLLGRMWYCTILRPNGKPYGERSIEAKTEAECRGLMLEYLLKNEFIKL